MPATCGRVMSFEGGGRFFAKCKGGPGARQPPARLENPFKEKSKKL